MRMEDSALDFHDRNCFDCERREPVGFPNISLLLSERDRKRTASRKRKEAEAEEEARKHKERKQELASCRQGASHDQLALLNLIESVDQEPSKNAVDILLEGIAAAPDAACSGQIFRALEVLHSGEGKERTGGALTALHQLPYSRQKLVELSLVALSRGDDVDISFEIVIDHLQEESGHLAGAIPALVRRCLPKTWSMLDSHRPPPKPQALVACNRVAPGLTVSRLREALRADSKEVRRAAALAIRAILRTGNTQTFQALMPELVSSFSLRDDNYDHGPAAADVARTLSVGLQVLPDETDSYLSEALGSADQDTRKGALRSYQEVFGRWPDYGAADFHAPPSDEAQPYERMAFSRLFSFFCSLPIDESLMTVAEFFRSSFRYIPWDLQVEAVEPLLGTAALAAEQLRRLHSGIIESALEDLSPPQESYFDKLGRDNQLSYALNCSLAAVESIISRHPSGETRSRLLQLVSEMISGLPVNADRCTYRLVQLVGKVARSVPDKPLALRQVYLALTSSSVLVRVGAARAYQDLVRAFGHESLPQLLHETFLTLLMDPYVAVHSSGIEALGSLPESLRPRAIQLTYGLVEAYANPSDDVSQQQTLVAILRSLFFQLKQSGGYQDFHGRFILSAARRLRAHHLYDFLSRAPEDLCRAEGFADLLLLCPISTLPLETLSPRILELLAELPDEEVRKSAEAILERGSGLAARGRSRFSHRPHAA